MRSPFPKSKLGPALVGASALYLLVWVTNVVALGVASAFAFDGPPSDGPFQIFNPLRRLHAGQLPGQDFQFFHGIGVPLAHYPIFALFGGNLTASELSRQLTSPLLVLAVLLLGWRWASGRLSHAIPLAALSILVFDSLPLSEVIYVYGTAFGARTALPLLACAAMMLPWPPLRAGLLAGALAASALLLGSEQGSSLIVGGLIVAIFELLLGRAPEGRRFFLGALLGLVVTLPILLLLITRGHPHAALSILRFNFSEVSEDQLWYFGSDPALFLWRWHQLLEWPRPWIPVVIMLPALGIVLRRRWRLHGTSEARSILRLDAGLVLGIYGLISLASLLGLYESKNMKVCFRSAVLLWLGLAYFGLWLRTAPLEWQGRRFPLRPALVGIFLVWMALALGLKTRYAPYHASVATVRQSVREAVADVRQGPTLASYWKDALQKSHVILAGKEHPVIWSTYAGLPEEEFHTFHPETDYIIHVLGLKRRAHYLQAFDQTQADMVQTERLTPYYGYEEWIQSTAWPFYERVLKRYVPAAETFHSLLWRPRTPSDAPVIFGPSIPLAVAPDNTIHLPPAAPVPEQLAVVTLAYETHAALHWLPILGKTPRFVVKIDHALDQAGVSLNPHTHETSFPVHYKPGETPTLQVRVKSLVPGASVNITRASVRFLTLPPAYAPFAMSALAGGTPP